MWPQRGEALSRTIEAEAAVADLYAETLRRWAPAARAAVLPTLTADVGDPLPPDPDALEQTQSVWDEIAEAVIIAGLGLLWAVTFLRTRDELGLPAPVADQAPPPDAPPVDAPVVSIVARASEATPAEVRAAAATVHAASTTRQAVADFTATRRPVVSATLGVVRAKVTAAITTSAPTATAAEVRAAASEVLEPASQVMRDVARNEGYQAAGVLNHAVVEAARGSDEELQKTWICTIDGKTRPTHWAADGQRVPLDGKFTIGSEELAYPGDESAHPREWKNCRCRVGILAPDEPLPDEVDRHTERLDGRDSVAIHRQGRTQAEEIERRAREGNVRARDTDDGIGRVASAGWTAEQENTTMTPKPSDLAAKMALAAAEQDEQGEAETFLTFSGVIGKLGVATSDRRILAPDIELTFREFPLPVGWCKQSSGGHYDSFTVGVVETGEIQGSDVVVPGGYFLNTEEAMEAAEQVAHKVSAPSLDLAAAEYIFTDEDGNEIEGDLFEWWEENGEPYVYFTKAEVTGFTLVQTPAFDGIDIELGERETRDVAVVAAIVAAADEPRLQAYDPALFEDPKLTRPTAPTMNNETGRIYGHLAEWGHKIRGGTELTPRNRNGYANFHTSQVLLTNGKQLSVGRLTVQGGHADTSPGVTMATARAHYDNVCTAFGLVRVGEDEFGIWFSGVPAPGVDPEVFQAGMTAPLSGDWRDCGQGLDMIAAHAVNSPGYPIYSAVTGADGRELALVASLGPSRRSKKTGGGFTLDRESLKALLTEVVETVDQRLAARAAAELAAAADRRKRTQAMLARSRDASDVAEREQRVAALLERS